MQLFILSLIKLTTFKTDRISKFLLTPTMSLIKEAVYEMSVDERLDRLIHGYFQMNYTKKYKTNQQIVKYLSSDIAAICANYTGITVQNDYHLIISNKELKQYNNPKKHLDTFFKENNKIGIGK
eukprot:154924_1